MGEPCDGREWLEPARIARYRVQARAIPHWGASEEALLEHVPATTRRVLDLGTGDGRLVALVLGVQPRAEAVGLDLSPQMLRHAAARLGTRRARLVAHDLADPLPALGEFDLVVSGFAIHHLPDGRKRVLYEEIRGLLQPGGQFLNLEHVASATPRLHHEFLTVVGDTESDEDPSDRLAPVDEQLRWLRDAAFHDVDCHWKWREIALLGGRRPEA